MNQTLTLTNEWDKTFTQSEKVGHSKGIFYKHDNGQQVYRQQGAAAYPESCTHRFV